MSVMQIISAGGLLPETMTQCRRIVADGGTIVDQRYMDRIIRTMKAQGIYTSAKYIGDANIAVKKDESNAVSVLYDISGNNNDAVQATGANQPIWTAGVQNGKAGLVFDGDDDKLVKADASIGITIAGGSTIFTILGRWTGVSSANGNIPFHVGHSTVYQKRVSYILSNAKFGVSNWGDDIVSSGVEFTTDTPYLLLATFDAAATTAKGFINGAEKASGNLTDIQDAPAGIYVGGAFNPNYSYQGSVCGGIAFTAAITTAQRQAMESLINTYYAIY